MVLSAQRPHGRHRPMRLNAHVPNFIATSRHNGKVLNNLMGLSLFVTFFSACSYEEHIDLAVPKLENKLFSHSLTRGARHPAMMRREQDRCKSPPQDQACGTLPNDRLLTRGWQRAYDDAKPQASCRFCEAIRFDARGAVCSMPSAPDELVCMQFVYYLSGCLFHPLSDSTPCSS